jgi:hypothetical protein
MYDRPLQRVVEADACCVFFYPLWSGPVARRGAGLTLLSVDRCAAAAVAMPGEYCGVKPMSYGLQRHKYGVPGAGTGTGGIHNLFANFASLFILMKAMFMGMLMVPWGSLLGLTKTKVAPDHDFDDVRPS